MVVLTVVVVIKVFPGNDRLQDPQLGANVGSGEEQGKPGGVPSQQEDGRRIIAKIGKESITLAELEAELRILYGDTVLRTLMVHKVIDMEAAESGISVSAEEQSRELDKMVAGYESEARFYEVMLEQLGMSKEQVQKDLHYRLLLEKIATQTVIVSDSEVERYIRNHREEYEGRSQLHLQWIMTKTAKEANSVLRLLAGGEDFGLLARTYSIDSFTADTGGDLGMIDQDDPFYNREMLDTASRLQVAEAAGPIKVDGGYVVIRLLERQMTTPISGRILQDEVRKQLALERAESLTDVEDELLNKYDAVKID
jgi:foldase protein PrsA